MKTLASWGQEPIDLTQRRIQEEVKNIAMTSSMPCLHKKSLPPHCLYRCL